MNRRIFLQRSSMAVVIAAGLPKAIRQNRQTNYPTIYKSELQYGVSDQLIYELGLYHSAIENFNLAKEEEKAVGLKVKFYEKSDQLNPKTGEFKYVIQRTELIDKDSKLWKITTRADKSLGEYSFPANYPKDLGFLCIPYSFVKITGKNDSVLVSIPYPPVTSSYNNNNSGLGCFLTTACVKYKGLPDDCEELTMLRLLRSKFMSQHTEGQLLLKQYGEIGPEIVNAIDSCENKKEIYEWMYNEMIMPSVQLVQEGKYEMATAYYKIFVKALKEHYC